MWAPNAVRFMLIINTTDKGRTSWDLITVVYAIRGGCKPWELSEKGKIKVDKDGVTWFNPISEGVHYYINNLAPVREIEEYIDRILVKTSV